MAADDFGYGRCFVGGQPLLLKQVGELGPRDFAVLRDFLALASDLRQRDLALALAREVLTSGHAEDPRQTRGDAGNKDGKAIVGGAAHRADYGERTHEAVLGTENRLTYVTEETGLATLVAEADAYSTVGNRCARPGAT